MRLCDVKRQMAELWNDPTRRGRTLLNLSLGLNLIYALFKLIAGGWFRSAWMIGLGVYYAMLAIMRFMLMRKIHHEDSRTAWKTYRNTGWLTLILTAVIAVIILMTFLKETTFVYPGVLIYAFALYAFVKVITVIVSLIRRREDKDRVLAAARCVSFSQALMSILALQVALLSQFGHDAQAFTWRMNGMTGAGICLLIVGLAIWMLIRANRQLRIREEE